MSSTRRTTATWIGFAVVGVLAMTFWHHPALWPIKILVVLFHELGHAIATWATGGTVIEIGLSPQQGGHALSSGGSRFLILNAGYLGSLVWGLLLLAAGRKARPAKMAMGLLGATVLATTVWFVRPIIAIAEFDWYFGPMPGFGFSFGLIMGVVLLIGARFLPAVATQVILRGLGVFSVLYALFDIRDDIFLSSADAVTDASMLAAETGVPAMIWGALWLVLGVGVVWATRRWIT